MKKLIKTYGLNSDKQYFEMIVDSFHNGRFTSAYTLFCAMPKANKVEMLKLMTVGGWNSGLANHKISNLFDLV
jgi:hypothetical protein